MNISRGDGNKDFKLIIGSDDGDKENEPQQENVTNPPRRFACDSPKSTVLLLGQETEEYL